MGNSTRFLCRHGAIALIDNLIPKYSNPHEVKKVEDIDKPKSAVNDPDLMKMGVFTALAIGIHNFPEGIATFVSTLQDPAIGVAIAIADCPFIISRKELRCPFQSTMQREAKRKHSGFPFYPDCPNPSVPLLLT